MSKIDSFLLGLFSSSFDEGISPKYKLLLKKEDTLRKCFCRLFFSFSSLDSNIFIFCKIPFLKPNGELLAGGKYALQRKVDGVYKDMLLIENSKGSYTYDSTATSSKTGATYVIETDEGSALIGKLPTGEYRVVEKEAPEGYELVADKDSTAKVTISDSGSTGYYLVEMVDRQVTMYGDEASAELVITIITGRTMVNYVAVAGVLIVLLIVAIYLRKKIKK